MAGDRLQIVLAAKDEITQELKQVKAEMTSLGRTANALQNRIENGEQGLQSEYEQTRRQLEQNRQKQLQLGRAAAEARSDIKKLTTEGTAGAKRMDRSFDGVNRTMKGTQSASSKLTVGWGKMMGAVALVTTAVASLGGAFRFLTSSIEEARTARKAMAQTEAVMRSMGRTEAPEAINKLIDGLAELAGMDDDAIREMVNILLTFGNVSGEMFDKAALAALDVSVAFGKDLPSAAVMVGKALNDPIKGLTALTRVGVSFTAQQQEKIKSLMEEGKLLQAQKIIMAELTRQTAGSAKAQADGIGKTQVAWENLKEAIGEVLMSTGTGFDLADILKDATKWIKRHKDEIVSVLQKVISMVLKVISAFLKWQSIFLRVFGEFLGAMATTLKVLAALGIVSDSTAAQVDLLANQFGDASKKADEASKWFDEASRKADKASQSSKRLKDKLDAVGVAVDKLNRKKVNDLLRDTPIPGVNRQGGIPVAFAGGPVFGPTLVGELGPELFVPKIGVPRVIGADGPEIRDFHQSGTVIPNHLLATVTLPQRTPQPVGYNGPPVQIGTINATQDVDVEGAILRATLRADRIARERR